MLTRQYVLALSFALMGFASNAQTTLVRQVVGSSGFSEILSGNTEVSTTIGEAVVTTETGNTTVLTQGFHQPGVMFPLVFNVETVDASCPTSSDGGAFITGLMGCELPYTVAWSNGDSGTESPNLSPGLYAVTVAGQDCELTVEFEISSGPESGCVLKFFNAFSPNDDGNNDLWEIENIQADAFSNNSVEIYNRWGQLIWSGEGYNNTDVAWNGKTKSGLALADGTYYYIAKVNSITYKGYIELTK